MSDYPAVRKLYEDSSTFGGQYDDARDTQDRLEKLIAHKPNSLLVAEEANEIIGTVTLFEDGRSAWLYRFAVKDGDGRVAEALYQKAKDILTGWGHTQVLVYAPAGDTVFEERYAQIGFTKGNNYTAYWQDL